MRAGKTSLNLIAACGLVMTSTAALADHIPGHDNCDPVFPVPLPGQEFFDGGVLFGTLIGPLADSVITNTTFDITYVSDGATPASDLFIEIMVQVDDKFRPFCLTGADLGFGSGPGTFQGTLQTDVLNGVVWPGFLPPNSTVDLFIDAVGGGGIQGSGFFVDSFILFDVIPPPDCPGLDCGTGRSCLDGLECVTECGELVQGVECVLFLADSGGLFLLENLDGFNVGDRVEVTGCLDPGCINICLQGDGCIFQNTIGECPQPGAERTLIIKQGACPAPLNPSSNGVTPMALVGAADFDVNDIDLSSLSLARCDGVGDPVAPNDGPPGPPGSRVIDLNHPNPDPATCQTGGCTCNDDQSSDGIDDLHLMFNTDEMAAAFDLDPEPVGSIITLVLSGELNDGSAFTASDCIRIVGGGGGSSGALAVGANLPHVWVDVSPLDDALDEGGYTSFHRTYPQASVVTVTAPVVPYAHPNWVLANIWIDGVSQAAMGDGTIQVTIEGDANSVVLQYRQTQFNNRGITPGIGGNTQHQ